LRENGHNDQRDMIIRKFRGYAPEISYKGAFLFAERHRNHMVAANRLRGWLHNLKAKSQDNLMLDK
jgi:hypothetical protein